MVENIADSFKCVVNKQHAQGVVNSSFRPSAVLRPWTHLDRGRSSPGTHPEPSTLLPPAPSPCCVKFALGAAAESLQTTTGKEKQRLDV